MKTSWFLNNTFNSWIIEKAREFQKKTSTSDLLLYQSFRLCGSQPTLENSWRDGNNSHLTCLLRNIYAGQEGRVRTAYRTTDWFQIGEGICQGCIVSPCLFNLYAEYIMQNARLESRLLREISITSDMQMTPPLWQKVKRN